VKAVIEFCGEELDIPEGTSVSIGREGNLVIDDNPYLHRQFLNLSVTPELVWLINVGAQMSATVSDAQGLTQTWLAPSARMPIVFERTTVWFTAGPTTYDFDITVDGAPLTPSPLPQGGADNTTLGVMGLTPDQRLLVVALAEPVLRRGVGGKGNLPSSAAAARRLGWTTTKFNRKLDNVCEKLSRIGIVGLVGSEGDHASSRRSRLVEFAVATRLVTANDLRMLDE
jgi:hypothetical protein